MSVRSVKVDLNPDYLNGTKLSDICVFIKHIATIKIANTYLLYQNHYLID